MALFMQCKNVFCITLQRIIFVLEGPQDGAELGRVNGAIDDKIDEGLDNCDFEVFEGTNGDHERQNIQYSTSTFNSRATRSLF